MYCTVYMTSLLGSRDRPGNTAELVILYKSVYVLYMTNLLGSRDRPGNTAELVILYMYCTVLYCTVLSRWISLRNGNQIRQCFSSVYEQGVYDTVPLNKKTILA